MARKGEGLEQTKQINGLKRFSYNPNAQATESKEAGSRLSAHQTRRTSGRRQSDTDKWYPGDLSVSRVSYMGSQQNRDHNRFQVQSPDSVEGQSYRDQSNSFLRKLNTLNAQNLKNSKAGRPHRTSHRKPQDNIKGRYDEDPPKQTLAQVSYSPIQKLQDKFKEGGEGKFKSRDPAKQQDSESENSKKLNRQPYKDSGSRSKADLPRNRKASPPRFDSKKHNPARSLVQDQRISRQVPRYQQERQSRQATGRQPYHYPNQKLQATGEVTRPSQPVRGKSESVRQTSRQQIQKRRPSKYSKTTEEQRRSSLTSYQHKDAGYDGGFGKLQCPMRKSTIQSPDASELALKHDDKNKQRWLNASGTAESEGPRMVKNGSHGSKPGSGGQFKPKPKSKSNTRQQKHPHVQVMERIREIEQINSDQESKLSSYRNGHQKQGQEQEPSQREVVQISQKAEKRFQQFLKGLDQLDVVPHKPSRSR